jgi:hypothetical protein
MFSFSSFLILHGSSFSSTATNHRNWTRRCLCGFMGNNLYPCSCIELWAWVIISNQVSGWETLISAVDISNCSRESSMGYLEV